MRRRSCSRSSRPARRPRSPSTCPRPTSTSPSSRTARSRSRSGSRSSSTARSRAPTATSRFETASGSATSRSPRAPPATRPEPRRSSARAARRTPTVRRRSTGGYRIVWHFQALSEPRTFTVSYRLSNLAVAFDDVVDVDLNVWGDQWDQTLQQLTAELTLPGPASGPSWRVWGHPVSVRGDVIREPGSGAPPGRGRPSEPVRRAARRLPAKPPDVDRRREGATGRRLAADRGRGDCRCGRLRGRPGEAPAARSTTFRARS